MSSSDNSSARKTNAPATKTVPVASFRLGRIQAAVWANPTDDGKTFYNVTFSRSYKDGKGEWKNADSYGRDDLPLVAKLADKAHTYIFEKLAEEKDDTTNAE